MSCINNCNGGKNTSAVIASKQAFWERNQQVEASSSM
jgi:hypothetical protein